MLVIKGAHIKNTSCHLCGVSNHWFDNMFSDKDSPVKLQAFAAKMLSCLKALDEEKKKKFISSF